MKTRFLRDLEVSPIGMGCMGFSYGYGYVPEESYAVEAIRKAHDFGCTFFDTAESYGKEQFYAGHNEELEQALDACTVYGHRGHVESEQTSFGNNWKKK